MKTVHQAILESKSLDELIAISIGLGLNEYSTRWYGFDMFIKLKAGIKDGDVLEADWLNYRRGSGWDKPEMLKESAYEDCVSLDFDLPTKCMRVNMGDRTSQYSFSRGRTEKKCTWLVQVGPHMTLVVEALSQRLVGDILSRAEEHREREEELARKRREDQILGQYLSGDFTFPETE